MANLTFLAQSGAAGGDLGGGSRSMGARGSQRRWTEAGGADLGAAAFHPGTGANLAETRRETHHGAQRQEANRARGAELAEVRPWWWIWARGAGSPWGRREGAGVGWATVR